MAKHPKTSETEPPAYEANLDADAAAAERVNSATMADDFTLTQYAQEVTHGTGVRVNSAFAMKNFVPDLDWIMKNVVAHGKGTHVLVGRISGDAMRAEHKQNEWQGKLLDSIAIHGAFDVQFPEGSGYLDQAVSTIFLPKAFAQQLETALADTSVLKPIKIDIDVGLEATGKNIPYQWTVVTYLEGKAERARRTLKTSRKIGQPALPGTLLTGPAPRLIGAAE